MVVLASSIPFIMGSSSIVLMFEVSPVVIDDISETAKTSDVKSVVPPSISVEVAWTRTIPSVRLEMIVVSRVLEVCPVIGSQVAPLLVDCSH